nr:hypothetical protein Iba_chr07aCG6660 [Ipomoea batatas]
MEVHSRIRSLPTYLRQEAWPEAPLLQPHCARQRGERPKQGKSPLEEKKTGEGAHPRHCHYCRCFVTPPPNAASSGYELLHAGGRRG